MIEPHIDPTELNKKITELFEYRLFTELLQGGRLSPLEIETLWHQLIELQTAIYHLDAHLEAHIDPDMKILRWHWANMKEKLEAITGLLPENHNYFDHIEIYQKHELNLRNCISPLSYDIFQFYYYKSCDVKLLRRLIYEKNDISDIFGSLEEWKYYDLITEVNDDVEDIWEDMTFINGNMFLISVLLQGNEKTETLYTQFMKEISSSSQKNIQNTSSPAMVYINDVTQKRVLETQNLMHHQFQDKRILSCHEARISELTNTMK